MRDQHERIDRLSVVLTMHSRITIKMPQQRLQTERLMSHYVVPSTTQPEYHAWKKEFKKDRGRDPTP